MKFWTEPFELEAPTPYFLNSDSAPLIREMLLELKNERPAGCKFFFHHKGKMLRYQMIREEINKALIQSGYGDYSATHILRHSMGSYSRKEGELDVNEKVTGVILGAEKLFEKSVTKLQSECDQSQNVVNL